MGRHRMDDASCSCPQLLLVPWLLLITSLIPTVPGSPRVPIANSTLEPCSTANKTEKISYCNLPRGNRTRGGGSRLPAGYSTAPLNTFWVNRDAKEEGGATRFTYRDGSIVSPLLLRAGRSFGPSFACGFFCRHSCNATLFSIFLVVTNSSTSIADPSSGFPQVVWSANRNNTVGEGARLLLTSDGQLVLSDSGGAEVWSTPTVGKNVSGMNLTEAGNLVLYASTGEIVWQSFDYPTDTVLHGQSAAGQMLVANASATNSTKGKFSLSVTNDSFYAFIDSVGAPSMYYSELKKIKGGILFRSSSQSDDEGVPARNTDDIINPAYQFMRLDCDGHLRLYRWSSEERSWTARDRLIGESGVIPQCSYPNFCGNYGICSDVGQCRCPPDDNYFQKVDERKPNSGCHLSAPLFCESRESHDFVPLENISYFGYVQPADLLGTDVNSCKEACLNNCSCKAAFFKSGDVKYRGDPAKGDCYLPSQIFSLIDNPDDDTGHKSVAFVKVQRVSQHGARKHSRIQGSSLAAFFALLLLGVVAAAVVLQRRRKKDELEGWEVLHLPGMTARFSYKELKSATGNFSRLLGEGGFGSVYHGTLFDGMSVAVKLLGGKSHGLKEFIAEVETIGSIHHVNLVRLVGYCAHKLHRLLVYEYMCNGSLDRWIFCRDDNPRTLDWPTRHKIMLHVAKGLEYLHEDCRHRIVHLDIKPENILLDDGFNAKVSDFGLSKLIDRDQSQVLTTMRGTPGYLAPEWLTSMITEKVDVYSFGVVVLETVCGRRNIEVSRLKQNSTLVKEAKSAVQEGRLVDIVDRKCRDIEHYGDEAIKMARIGLWCLQEDPDRRPPMSAVVKLLEGATSIEPLLDFSVSAPTQEMDYGEIYLSSSTPTLASTLSQPR